MDKKANPGLVVDTYRIYSLDRCVKCLNVLNLGQNAYCTVGLVKTRPAAERPGEAGTETA